MASRQGTVFASQARTATPTAAEFDTQGCKGVRININTSAAGSSPSTIFSVYAKDSLSGSLVLLLASAAITATGFVSLYIYPGAVAVTNLVANAAIGSDTIQVAPVHGNATSHTYTVSYYLIP